MDTYEMLKETARKLHAQIKEKTGTSNMRKMGSISQATFSRLMANSNGIKRR